MHRWLAALFAVLGAGCSKTEQPAASEPPPPAWSAPGSASAVSMVEGTAPRPAPIAPGVAAPSASVMRGQPSLKVIPAPRPTNRAERPPGQTSQEQPGIERLALLPGSRVIAPEEIPAPPTVAPTRGPIASQSTTESAGESSPPNPDDAPAPRSVAPRSARSAVSTTIPADAANAAEPEVITQEPPATRPSTPAADSVPDASSIASSTQRQRRLNTLNELVIDSIQNIPAGGEYRADANAIDLLRQAVTISDRRLQIIPDLARPSFCSSATYLVFLTVMDRLHRGQRLQISEPALTALLIQGQPDGEGVWGRWNANGPGTARLFHELGLGRSFCDPATALPGDFLKIWWNDEIGAKERGHSVIFLGMEKTESGEMGVRYWSSNKPGGFGEAVAPMSKVKRMLFSRLEDPRAIANATRLPRVDRYLADMLKRRSTEAEMFQKCGLR